VSFLSITHGLSVETPLGTPTVHAILIADEEASWAAKRFDLLHHRHDS